MPVHTPTRDSDTASGSARSLNRLLTVSRAWTSARVLAVIVGGLALYAASPPRQLWWLAPASFMLLALATHHRRGRTGFVYGALFGFSYLLPLLSWLYDFLGSDFGVFPWLGLVALESAFFGLAGAGMARVSRLPVAPVWMAAVFVASELLRSRVPFGGFPWGRVAFTQADGPLLPLASLGGAALVSFAVVVSGCALARLVTARATRRAWVVSGALAVLPGIAGWATTPAIDSTAEEGTVTVAVVQGNAPNIGIALMGESATVRANHIAQTERLVADVRAGRLAQPDVVILPESSNTFAVSRDDPDLTRIAAALDAPIAAGGIAFDADGTSSNRMVLWDPSRGATEEYAKQQLVAFSEFIPLRPIAGLVTPFAAEFSDMVAGDRTQIFDMGAARIGFAICYEVAYDYVLNEATRAGAQVLAVPTNNAWFGRTEMTYQQLAMSRIRAVENSRAVIVAATSGVSAVVQPDGTVTRSTGQYTAETIVEEIPKRTSLTPATRLGGAPEWVLAGVGVLALGMTLRRPKAVASTTPR